MEVLGLNMKHTEEWELLNYHRRERRFQKREEI